MDQDRAERAAQFMLAGHRAGADFRQVPEDIRPRDVAEAYAAQEAFQRLWTGSDRPPFAGYKIAATARVIQEQFGLREPMVGGVFEGTIHDTPVVLEAANYIQLAYECEIAFRMGRDLGPDGAPYARDAVAAAVATAHPSFEILDMRNAVPQRMDALSVIACNCMNCGIALGPGTADWQRLDMGNLTGTLTVGGELAEEGNTGAAMGNPLDGLTWVANNLASRGHTLAAGMVVITGGIIATRYTRPGEHMVYDVDTLGAVELHVR